MAMVIFHSYVSVPEGKYLYTSNFGSVYVQEIAPLGFETAFCDHGCMIKDGIQYTDLVRSKAMPLSARFVMVSWVHCSGGCPKWWKMGRWSWYLPNMRVWIRVYDFQTNPDLYEKPDCPCHWFSLKIAHHVEPNEVRYCGIVQVLQGWFYLSCSKMIVTRGKCLIIYTDMNWYMHIYR